MASSLPADDVLTLAIDPQIPTTLYAGASYLECFEYCFGVFNVYKSTDGGGTWNTVSDGLNGTEAYALAIDPQSSTTLYAGNPTGVFKSTNGWRKLESRQWRPGRYIRLCARH